MSEEVALADSNVREIQRLRTAVTNAQRLASDWQKTADQQRAQLTALESQLGQAHTEIARLTEALRHCARMATICRAADRRRHARGVEETAMAQPPPPKPPIVLEAQRPTDLQRLARLLAELAWKRAQAVQSPSADERAA